MVEDILVRLMAMALFAGWLLALGLAGKCISLLAPGSLFLAFIVIAALVLAVPFVALGRYLEKKLP